MYLFYTPNINTDKCLSEEESAHCIRVLRYTIGDEILLTDGQGKTYQARISNPNPKHCEFEVLQVSEQPKTHKGYIHIAIAPTKNIERIEWMVEKCTEIGVDEITPLLCRFSERKQIRIDRLQKVILSAAKQSLTPYLPILNELTPFDAFIKKAKETYRFIGHCYNNEKTQLVDALAQLHSDNETSYLVLIGPEGDFSEEEVTNAFQLGFCPIALGNSRLRTETAGVVACTTIVSKNIQ